MSPGLGHARHRVQETSVYIRRPKDTRPPSTSKVKLPPPGFQLIMAWAFGLGEEQRRAGELWAILAISPAAERLAIVVMARLWTLAVSKGDH